ncbi:MAG: hypothetical protein EXQ47_03235 [Bryobacterales bacterium]|nr:hypothetical protein [Bryobacterales bacterium]
MRAWLPALLLVYAHLCAQSPSAPYPLIRWIVQGNHHFTAEQIMNAAGLKPGQQVSKETFDAARDRLMETGGFESVGYAFKPSAEKNGYDATFDVAEVALLYQFRFADLPAPGDRLRALLRQQETLFADEIPATPEVLNRYNGVLTKFLEGKIEVLGRLSYDLPGPPMILFRPAGDRPRISQIHFTGNESLAATQLFNTFSGVAVGKEFSEDTVRRLLDLNIRPLFEARGKLRVAFPKITAAPSQEADVVGVAVDITIEEGPEFKLGNVRYAGAATRQAKDLDTLAKWRKDEVVNFDEIKAGVDRITHQFKSKGYLHAESRVDRTVNDKEQTVDLVVDVKTGEIYTYGKLEIRGLDLYGEPAVRKQWGTREGKPFDPEAPDAFLKEAQAMFDDLGSTSSETKVNEAAKTADVTLIFAGTKNPGAGRHLP